MPKWIAFASCHWAVLLVELALSATVVAWISIDLVTLAMANVNFISRFGLLALRDGGLVQLLQIGGTALVALLAYLVFKAAETELVSRWRR